jgi:gliding motility-associated-like protein
MIFYIFTFTNHTRMKAIPLLKIKTTLTLLLFWFALLGFSQGNGGDGMGPNTANNWNFEDSRGVDFSTGYPVNVPGSLQSYGGATISDTSGHLLFYTNDNRVFNRDHVLMENGQLIGFSHYYSNQFSLIIPVPESSSRYYIFTVGNAYDPVGLYYHTVDMSLNGGMGSVVNKNNRIEAGIKAQGKLSAIRHQNKRDFWVVTRIVFDSCYAAFCVTPDGVDPIPVRSHSRYLKPNENQYGEMKFSPNGEFLVEGINYYDMGTYISGFININEFNSNTGIINEKFSVHQDLMGVPGSSHQAYPMGHEFSPDSKFLYVGFYGWIFQVWQYEMQMDDPVSFLDSGVPIFTTEEWIVDLQLAPDGKIYVKTDYNKEYPHDTLDVINKPWLKGIDCEYIPNYYDPVSPWLPHLMEPFPNFIQEQLYRFIWNDGPCAKTPFTFRHRFIPEPESIVWNFGDGTTSTDFNPTHVWETGGNYEVHAYVVYPDGRIEETSREVEVLAAPEPDLGDDTLMCSNAIVELDAGAGFTQYVWNEQFPPGNQFYTITDTGYYRVRVKNDLNCYGYDTVHVALHPSVFLDTSQAEISNTTCNNSTGAIRGIMVSPAAIIEWRDGSGNLVGSEIDITGLAAGNYFLTVIDTTGCVTVAPGSFNIDNTDFNLIIESANSETATCGQSNGSIQVETSVFSDLLLFSCDNGNTWYDNMGSFTNLAAGPYMVRVKDMEGCAAAYDNNPVWVTDAGGPLVTYSGSSNATGSNSNGTITVTAHGDSLYYQLNGGTAQDTGYFEGLAPDLYYITITDKYGCDTTVSVLVTSESGYQLSALAGDDRQCLRKMATSVLKVSNLNGVKDFKATILFNSLLLECFGYDQPFHDNLTVTEFPDRIELEWHGNLPLTLTDTVSLVHLIFETKLTGVADVNWDMAGSSYFRDENGINIPCEPIDGEIMISDPPVLVTNGDQRVCEGEFAVISADAFLGVPPYTLELILPDGTTTNESPIWLPDVGAQNAGEYTIKVTDLYNCVVNDTVRLEVIPPPSANLPQDTIPFEQHFTLEATSGYFSYEWNTGDTTYFITGTEEGNYSVIIKTQEGCTTIDSTYLKDVYMPFYFNVPNAFTPNGDGLNDIFRPVATTDLIRQFSMVIYNRWGQLIFGTSNPAEGWDGKDAPAGVYSWVINYSNNTGTPFQLKGMVSLIK